RRELGQYGVTPRVLALDAGAHRIWVEKDGFRPAETNVELGLGGESQVMLHPEQILGRLRVESPTAAQVRVVDTEGHVVAEGPTPFEEGIPPGTYRAEARAGEERWSEPVLVRAEQTSALTAALVGPTGAATVTANVTGALVSLDGREQGFTPQVLASIPVGEHALEVHAEGMRTYAGRLTIEEDDHAWVTIDLEGETASGVALPTWIVGGLALATGIAAGIMTGFAADANARFDERVSLMQPASAVADESRAFNLAADSLWIGAGLAAVITVVLLATTSDFESRPSRAMVTRGGR
ncbi:MAG: PEGA domain-containing protein, partial [Myxococcales bacterium]|nr:PEGA domain-containing protein [Myxococcales bacterium]